MLSVRILKVEMHIEFPKDVYVKYPSLKNDLLELSETLYSLVEFSFIPLDWILYLKTLDKGEVRGPSLGKLFSYYDIPFQYYNVNGGLIIGIEYPINKPTIIILIGA